jgi:hypothetical protein
MWFQKHVDGLAERKNSLSASALVHSALAVIDAKFCLREKMCQSFCFRTRKNMFRVLEKGVIANDPEFSERDWTFVGSDLIRHRLMVG